MKKAGFMDYLSAAMRMICLSGRRNFRRRGGSRLDRILWRKGVEGGELTAGSAAERTPLAVENVGRCFSGSPRLKTCRGELRPRGNHGTAAGMTDPSMINSI